MTSAVILCIATWNTSRGLACGHKADDRQIVLGMGFTAPVTRPSEEIRVGCPHDLHTGRVGEPAIKKVTLPSHDLAEASAAIAPWCCATPRSCDVIPHTTALSACQATIGSCEMPTAFIGEAAMNELQFISMVAR